MRLRGTALDFLCIFSYTMAFFAIVNRKQHHRAEAPGMQKNAVHPGSMVRNSPEPEKLRFFNN